MPNWKKVITSGSDASIRQLTASGLPVSAPGNFQLLCLDRDQKGHIRRINQTDLTAAGNDNLGNHIADQNLRMEGFEVQNASVIDFTGLLSGSVISSSNIHVKHSGEIDAKSLVSASKNTIIHDGSAIRIGHLDGTPSHTQLRGSTTQLFTDLTGSGHTISGSIINTTKITSDSSITFEPTNGFDIRYQVDPGEDILFRYGATNKYVFADTKLTVNADIDLTANLSASGFISTSNHLFASTSDAGGPAYQTVLVDTGSGQFYYTGSAGGEGFPFIGDGQITGSLSITGSRNDGVIFEVYGDSAPMFSIQDGQSNIFELKDISGIPAFTVDGQSNVTASGELNVLGAITASVVNLNSYRLDASAHFLEVFRETSQPIRLVLDRSQRDGGSISSVGDGALLGGIFWAGPTNIAQSTTTAKYAGSILGKTTETVNNNNNGLELEFFATSKGQGISDPLSRKMLTLNADTGSIFSGSIVTQEAIYSGSRIEGTNTDANTSIIGSGLSSFQGIEEGTILLTGSFDGDGNWDINLAAIPSINHSAILQGVFKIILSDNTVAATNTSINGLLDGNGYKLSALTLVITQTATAGTIAPSIAADSSGKFSIEGPTIIDGADHAIINWAGTDSDSDFANAQYEVILKYTVNKF